MQIVWKKSRRKDKETMVQAAKCQEESLDWPRLPNARNSLWIGPGCQMPGTVFGLAQAAICQEESLDCPRQPYARNSLWIAPGSHMPGTVFGQPNALEKFLK